MRPFPQTMIDRMNPRSIWGKPRGTATLGGLFLIGLMSLMACGEEALVPRPKGYFRIALHDTLFRTVPLDCPIDIGLSAAAWIEPVNNFAPDSCWFNLVYPMHSARIHCTYAGGVKLDPVKNDAFRLAYEHEIKADAIDIRQRELAGGGEAWTWRISGDAASPLQFLCTDGSDQFLRGALYFELRPNADSLAPVVSRISMDVDHLISTLTWR